MRAEYIVEKANQLLSRFGERDPYYAVTQTDAIVKYKDIGTLKGAYLGNMTPPVILINTNLDDNTQKIICAHELGHHILHKGQLLSCENIDFSSAAIMEREANIFAAAFLIDDKKAISLLSGGNTLEQTAAIMNTNHNLLCFLLNALKITDAPDSMFLK